MNNLKIDDRIKIFRFEAEFYTRSVLCYACFHDEFVFLRIQGGSYFAVECAKCDFRVALNYHIYKPFLSNQVCTIHINDK